MVFGSVLMVVFITVVTDAGRAIVVGKDNRVRNLDYSIHLAKLFYGEISHVELTTRGSKITDFDNDGL